MPLKPSLLLTADNPVATIESFAVGETILLNNLRLVTYYTCSHWLVAFFCPCIHPSFFKGESWKNFTVQGHYNFLKSLC